MGNKKRMVVETKNLDLINDEEVWYGNDMQFMPSSPQDQIREEDWFVMDDEDYSYNTSAPMNKVTPYQPLHDRFFNRQRLGSRSALEQYNDLNQINGPSRL